MGYRMEDLSPLPDTSGIRMSEADRKEIGALGDNKFREALGDVIGRNFQNTWEFNTFLTPAPTSRNDEVQLAERVEMGGRLDRAKQFGAIVDWTLATLYNETAGKHEQVYLVSGVVPDKLKDFADVVKAEEEKVFRANMRFLREGGKIAIGGGVDDYGRTVEAPEQPKADIAAKPAVVEKSPDPVKPAPKIEPPKPA